MQSRSTSEDYATISLIAGVMAATSVAVIAVGLFAGESALIFIGRLAGIFTSVAAIAVGIVAICLQRHSRRMAILAVILATISGLIVAGAFTFTTSEKLPLDSHDGTPLGAASPD
jgi:hypothetical protein